MDTSIDGTQGLSGINSKPVGLEGKPCQQEGDSIELVGPPEGFLFVLPFLDLHSRLTVERVSKSLREAVRNNPLVWQYLHVEWPANRKITEDILLTLVKRADGHLKSLQLDKCLRITETALEKILALNPGLEKLSVPGCTGISAEAIVSLVESQSLKGPAHGLPHIKLVHIRGLYNITKEHLDRLQAVLEPVGHHQHPPVQIWTPRYYGNAADELNRCDAQLIDVGVCPICTNVRMVYDCTTHLINDGHVHPCRGCTFCIPRCEECGCCIRDLSYDESLCSELVCTDCWLLLPKCSECNRAVCGRHAPQFVHIAGTTFTCEECQALADGPEFSFAGEV